MEDSEVKNPEIDETELSGGEYQYDEAADGETSDEAADADGSAEQEGGKKRKESAKAAENRRLKEQKREEEQKKKLEERREEARRNEEKAQKNGKMHWYFIQTYSGYELRVQKALKELLSNSPEELQDKFADILVPTEEVVEIKNGVKRRSERKFYPGYVLIRMEMMDATWHTVNDLSFVMGFVGTTKRRPTPNPISEAEAKRILDRINDNENNPKPKNEYQPGEVVRVIEGPFSDFNGTIEDVDYTKNKVRVSVMVFGRPTPIELEFSEVEKER